MDHFWAQNGVPSETPSEPNPLIWPPKWVKTGQKGVQKWAKNGSKKGSFLDPFFTPFFRVPSQSFTQTLQNRHQIDPFLISTCQKGVQKGVKNGHFWGILTPFWAKKGSILGPLFGPKSLILPPKWVKKGSQNGPKMGQKGVQNGSFWTLF